MTQIQRLKYWQGLTVGLMVLGYAGYYLCRSNLAVTLLAIAERADRTRVYIQRTGCETTNGLGGHTGNGRLCAW